jgi:RNA polymerase sigma factor (sigma-70 family)
MSPEGKPNASLDGTAFIADLRPALVAYFKRRCGNAAEAEDLAQDVILRALSHAQWSSAEEARGYIFRIALNRWRDRGRRKLTHGTELGWDDEIAQGVSEGISPERVLSSQEQLHRIASALQQLEERTLKVFVLCRLEQMKQKEIADLLGISVSAVEKHLVKALAHVARWMEKDGLN